MKTLTVGGGAAQQRRCCIFLHGLGDTGEGWAPVARMLPKDCLYVLPSAPVVPVTVNGGMKMPAWYDLASLELRQVSEMTGLQESRAFVAELVEHARSLGFEEVTLGGFSQGGAVSLSAAYGEGGVTGLRGVIAHSAYLPEADSLPPVAEEQAKQPLLMLHGEADPMVPMELGLSSKATLQAHGVSVDWHQYRGLEHGASIESVNEMKEFLK